MKKSRRLGSACVCVLVLLGFNTATHAATISFGPVSGSDSDAFSFSGVGSGSVSLSIDMNLQQFDPALGTLTGVDITLEFVSEIISSSITNNGLNTIDFISGGEIGGTDFSAPGGIGFGMGIGGTFLGIDVPPGVLGSALGGLESIQGTYAATTLLPYIGIGTVTATLNHTGSVSIDTCLTVLNCANLDTIGSHSATVRSAITYTFEPAVVPVPAAVWLFGSGLLGLIGIARRKPA